MSNREQKDKRFAFIYEDKDGNELFFTYYWYPSLKYAKSIAKMLLAESKLNDLKRIRVMRTIGY